MLPEEGAQIMKAALRILTAINSGRNHELADLEMILSFAPDIEHLDADDVACEVVNRIRKSMHLPGIERAAPD